MGTVGTISTHTCPARQEGKGCPVPRIAGGQARLSARGRCGQGATWPSLQNTEKYGPEREKTRSPGPAEVLFSPLKHLQHLLTPWFIVQYSWLACLAQRPERGAALPAVSDVSNWDPPPRPLGEAAFANSLLLRRRRLRAVSPPADKISAGGTSEGRGSPACLAVHEWEHWAHGNHRPPASKVSISPTCQFLINNFQIFVRFFE